MMPLTLESWKDNMRLIDRKTKLVSICTSALLLPGSPLVTAARGLAKGTNDAHTAA